MTEQNNYLGQDKIWALLFKFSVPCILSMVIGALYNIVDQLFIGNSRLGYLGNAATSIVYPITIIVLAFGLMWGDGCATYLSICQGRRDTSRIHRAIGGCITFSVAVGLIIVAVCALFADPILSAFGARGETLAYAKEYLFTLLFGIPFYLVATMLVSIVRADGSPRYSMVATCTGCIVNIILDPVFIYGFDMGMTGAAVATVIGQMSCFIFMMVYLHRIKTFRLTWKSLIPNVREVGKSSQYGISSFLTNISTVILSIVTNVLLAMYGATSVYGADIPIAVIGIVFKVFGIIISIAVGLAVGGQPILGYNFGAGNTARVRETFRKIMLCNVIIGAVATLLVELIPHVIIGWFGEGSKLYVHYAVLAFRIYLGLILFTCLTKAIAIFFQSIGKPFTAIAVALSRDIVFLIPGLIWFASLGGPEKGVETLLWAAPASDVLSMILCVVLVTRFFRASDAAREHIPERSAAQQVYDGAALTGKVITIGRSYGAGGRTVGKLLANKLHIPYYDSELLTEVAKASGLSRKYLEGIDEKPAQLATIYRSVGYGSEEYVPFEQKAMQAQREVIENIASKGACVIVGRRADQILSGNRNLVSVFIAGSEAHRCKRIMERDSISEKDAMQKIRKADKERAMYYNRHSSGIWADPSSYDYCFNTDKHELSTVADMIFSLIQTAE